MFYMLSAAAPKEFHLEAKNILKQPFLSFGADGTFPLIEPPSVNGHELHNALQALTNIIFDKCLKILNSFGFLKNKVAKIEILLLLNILSYFFLENRWAHH